MTVISILSHEIAKMNKKSYFTSPYKIFSKCLLISENMALTT